MDALPIAEQSGAPWCSKQSGIMHACGHDGHTAALLGTASWLKQHEAELTLPVTLLFQPAEEGGHGAREMIADGALNGIDEIYGWHNWPGIPFGELLCPSGTVMAGNGTFAVDIAGQGGHASQPERCKDPILAAAAITLNLQQIIARRVAPQSSAVVSVTSIEAPSGLTVIPETAMLAGSIRISDMNDKKNIEDLIVQICEDTARTYGVSCKVELHPRYQPTVNHGNQAEQVRQVWQQLYGQHALDNHSALPIMASEDFSYYLAEIPGAFALIGADDGPQNQHPCHSAYYDFNDRLLEKVIRWYCHLVGITTPNTT
jgi:hippurate hydrolase